MLKLKRMDKAQHALELVAAVWRRQGWDVALETPPRHGVWLPLADADHRWRGWMQPSGWLAHVAPELAGLASAAGIEAQVLPWLAAVEQPLELPIPELAYQRLWLGEPVAGTALPQRPLLRVMSASGPLWLESAPEPELADTPALDNLGWPLRFVVGDSSVSLELLKRVACGDVLLVREPASAVRCYEKTLGFYQILEEGITMEWQEQQEIQDEVEPMLGMGQLPVRLEFVLHRSHLTLAELQSLCQGQLLPLPVEAERQMEVRANGALIGRGELVQLDGQLGVEVNEWMGGTGDVE
ncbi:YscQ/HrcQ family type III secretion apparatus protein [Chromobacterium sinusclupearum]|uniref:Surface presentation of antigens protein SpaO n=1 Tax=Chromobacterium sinusclupearum TaxID=2077146 RepID=A0A2K4MUF8_9NEIS|nr:YscQ/HrcQ family type III secretion apparatus protein [Chromobacterium sinusclupearum]POB00613.1 YscQ/HrcQ family type III secretion apparatus protein [Chromobacterium sinusclupearum]